MCPNNTVDHTHIETLTVQQVN